MLDLTKLEQMLGGNKEMAQKFLSIFKEQTPTQLIEMRTAIASDDWDQASITAHAIKSQCKYLGLAELAEQALRIEKLAESKEQLSLLPGLGALLEEQIRSLIESEVM